MEIEQEINSLYEFDWLPNLEKNFDEKMSVADLATLRRIIGVNYRRFIRNNESARNSAFAVSVLRDMEDLGYKTSLESQLEFSKISMNSKAYKN